MTKKIRYIGCIIISLCVLLISGFVVGAEDISQYMRGYNDEEYFMYQYGQQVEDKIRKRDTNYSNVINRKNIEQCAKAMSKVDDSQSEKEIIKNYEEKEIEKQALFLRAIELGYEATNDEIQEAIQNSKLLLAGSEEEKLIKAFCDGANITIDEYWAIQESVYHKNLTIKKYYDSFQSVEMGKNNIIQNDVLSQTVINEEFQKEKERCIKEYKVTVE